MTLMEGLLPIIEEKENLRPITASLEPDMVHTFLREQARLERLAQATVNPPNAQRLYLEPITHEVFNLYSSTTEDTPMVEATDNEFSLFPVGHLNIMDESDIDEDTSAATQTPFLTLDLAAYRKRRLETNERIKRLMDISQREAIIIDATPSAAENVVELNAPVESTLPAPVQATPQQPEIAPAPVPVIQQATSVPASATTMEPSTMATSTSITWLDDPQIDTCSAIDPLKKPVYAYPDRMIPIFTTPTQQSELDTLAKSSLTQAAMFFNMHFDRAIGALNHPRAMVDASPKEKWGVSGKHIFIQELLTDLQQYDLALCIVTKDMDDEDRLLELIRDSLSLDCLRINTALDIWDGEYGVFIRTRNQQERIISAYADVVICMDVRISRDNVIFDKIKSVNEQKPPAVWLVTLGSIESKVFNYLKDHDTSFAVSKGTMEFKKLILQPNDWPKNSKYQEMNTAIVKNVSSWLISGTKQKVDYQFRSAIHLPQSYQLGTLAAENVKNVDIMDMDISSDSELANLSTIHEYIEKALFPLQYNIIEFEKANQDTTVLTDKEMATVQDIKANLVEKYQKEANDLKRVYEKEISDLREKYITQAKMTLEKNQ